MISCQFFYCKSIRFKYGGYWTIYRRKFDSFYTWNRNKNKTKETKHQAEAKQEINCLIDLKIKPKRIFQIFIFIKKVQKLDRILFSRKGIITKICRNANEVVLKNLPWLLLWLRLIYIVFLWFYLVFYIDCTHRFFTLIVHIDCSHWFFTLINFFDHYSIIDNYWLIIILIYWQYINNILIKYLINR